MWCRVATLLVAVTGFNAISSISHQSRVDDLGHGHLRHNHRLSHGQGDYAYGHQNHAWAYPSYKYSYSVNDLHTGDHKSQAEYRHGGLVRGSYSLAEPGGNMRSVHYSANDVHGFNAAVHHNTIHRYVPDYNH